jgi:hypothetical protein
MKIERVYRPYLTAWRLAYKGACNHQRPVSAVLVMKLACEEERRNRQTLHISNLLPNEDLVNCLLASKRVHKIVSPEMQFRQNIGDKH